MNINTDLGTMETPMLQDIGKVFDEMAEAYTNIMDDMVPHYRTLITSMFEFLPKGFDPHNILELGCGNGNITAVCRAIYPDAQYHLVDASAEMIYQCKKRFGSERIQYEKNFFQNLELEADKYDLMIAGFSLHHVPGPEKRALFINLHPALASGGVLTTSDLFVNKEDEPHHSEVMGQWRTFIMDNGRTDEDWVWIMDHYQKYDRPSAYADQKEWLKVAGFSAVYLSWNDRSWGCFHAVK